MNDKQNLYGIILSELENRGVSSSLSRELLANSIDDIRLEIARSVGETTAQNVSGVLRSLVAGPLGPGQMLDFLRKQAVNPYNAILQAREEADRFDESHGTETSTTYEQLELPEKVTVDRFLECARCIPSPLESVRLIFRRLRERGVPLQALTFIDIGSGLGRILLLALDHPFKRIVGIEISGYLHQKAVANIAAFGGSSAAGRIETYCMNALDYALPDDHLCLYFHEPFGSKSADDFSRRLEQHALSTGKKLVLIFLGRAFARIKESRHFRLADMFETADKAGEGAFVVVSIFESAWQGQDKLIA